MNEKEKNILSEAQAKCGSVAKSGRNQHQKYDYATLEDYGKIINPVASELGLSVVDSITKITHLDPVETKSGKSNRVMVQIESTLYANDDRVCSVVSCGEGLDPGDKATYKAITGARKYARAMMFNLVTTDDPEKDNNNKSMVIQKSRTPETERKKATLNSKRFWKNNGVSLTDMEEYLGKPFSKWEENDKNRLLEIAKKVNEISDPRVKCNYIRDVFNLEPGSTEIIA